MVVLYYILRKGKIDESLRRHFEIFPSTVWCKISWFKESNKNILSWRESCCWHASQIIQFTIKLMGISGSEYNSATPPQTATAKNWTQLLEMCILNTTLLRMKSLTQSESVPFNQPNHMKCTVNSTFSFVHESPRKTRHWSWCMVLFALTH